VKTFAVNLFGEAIDPSLDDVGVGREEEEVFLVVEEQFQS
jgi:hypothetical protein